MSATGTYTFEAEVWEHEGSGSWHFVSLPPAEADDIEARYGAKAAGFGSIRVEVTIGATRWRTSLFPDTRRATYVLPVKKAVRTAQGLRAGANATVTVRVFAAGA